MDVSVKIFHHPKNLESLSLLAASHLNKKSNSLIQQNVKDGLISSIVVKTPNGTDIVSVVAAVCYLFETDPFDKKMLPWLHWEANDLKPTVQHYIINTYAAGKPDTKLKSKLSGILTRLEETLAKTPYIANAKSPKAIDVLVWAQLVPVFIKNSPAEISGFPSIEKWFQHLNTIEGFQLALQAVLGDSSVNVIKGLVLKLRPINLLDGQTSRNEASVSAGASKEAGKKSGKSQEQKSKAGVVTQPGEVDEEDFPMIEVTAEEMQHAEQSFLHGASNVKELPPRVHPILPQKGRRNLLVTSALPYVNNVPHLGNIIGAVLSADVFSRYSRLRGYNVVYVCGTDEYGTATETKALADGVTPREICDKYHKLHDQIYQWFNIDFDMFGRTTTEVHKEISRDIFHHIYKRDFIFKDSVEQLYCTTCQKFLADRFVEGTCPLCLYDNARGDQCDKCGKLINAIELKEPKCKVCSHSPVIKSTEHLFLDLPKLQPSLESHLNSVMTAPGNLWTTNAQAITNSWLRDGLKPRCITRDLKWGVNVPLEGFTDKVFYVWYDAPIGYISITANYTSEWKQWWKNPKEVELYHFMAKDNVPFHSVIFPACLLAANDGYILVKHLVSCEYLNYEDTKFSKSRGVGVFGDNAKHCDIEPDIWRFYLISNRPENQDSFFAWDDFMLKNNSDLLNNLGNFINRALSFLGKFFGSEVQPMSLTDLDRTFLARINKEFLHYRDHMEKANMREALKCILNMSRLGNQYIQVNKPWVLVKSADTKARAGTVTSVAVNTSSLLGVLLHPFMPATSDTIKVQCQTPASAQQIHDHPSIMAHLTPGHKIGNAVPLFQKLEAEVIKTLKERYSGNQVLVS